MTIIEEMRETVDTAFSLGNQFHGIAHAIQDYADRLERWETEE